MKKGNICFKISCKNASNSSVVHFFLQSIFCIFCFYHSLPFSVHHKSISMNEIRLLSTDFVSMYCCEAGEYYITKE